MSVPSEPPIRIAGYEDFHRIGSGGFSAVYRARQTSLGREVAVKVLNAGFSTETDRRTFERECHTMGVLSRHPNIVTVYSEAFTDEGRPCIVLELYRGNYRERLEERGPLAVADLMSLGVKMAGALQSVHDSQILHRDLKPHNLFVSDYGEPALGDFGISTVDGERSITGSGGLSVAYAAPEVLEDSISGPAADIYSLGATLFHLLDGAAPFSSGNIRTTIRRILTEDPPVPNRSDVSVALVDVLHRALAKQSGDRYANGIEFAEGLRAVQASMGLAMTTIPLSSDRLIDTVISESHSGDGEVGTVIRVAPSTPPRPTIGERVTSKRPGATGERLGSAESAQSGAAVRPSRRPAVREVDSIEQTVARPGPADGRHAPPQREEVAPDEPSQGRRRMAIGLGVCAVVAVGLAVVASTFAGGDGDEPAVAPPSTPVEVEEPDDEFLAILQPPATVLVERDADGQAVVRFEAVDGAMSYEATSVAPSSRAGVVVRGEASPLITGASADTAGCWEVVAIGEGGRTSRPTPAVCVEA